MITRRGFIKSSGMAVFAAGLSGGLPTFVLQAAAKAFNRPNGPKKTLVCIFQRGAMDGLMAVTPFTDTHLQAARPNLFIAPGAGGGGLIDLDGRYGLHPALKGFERLFAEKQLAIVHGIGSPNTTRSHFDAQDYMESGTPFRKGTSSGWLNRLLENGHGGTISPFQAVSLTSALPRSLYGNQPAVAISNLQDFNIQMKGSKTGAGMAANSFEALYEQTSSELLRNTGKDSFEAMKMLQKTDVNAYKPLEGVVYPRSALGNSLKQIAQLIKMDVGMEIGFAESNGWDTHFNQGSTNGTFARNLTDFGNSIEAFWEDLGGLQDQVTLMSMTEFGRTVKENGTGGTDHGRASCNFILGQDVNGGVVYGKLDPLAKENLEDGRDLKVTTDFRAVFSEVAQSHLSINSSSSIFPDWTGTPLNIMKV
ncbi:uncharacterized protein (DUF1501 family) [Dyadobacter jejuensis]|uniref:Uncharacterized protein (DUF1501 family) n=1 Tax=Dyadobacter jejuensis TaxID=1082580 RepID=A0A316AMX1_9BACT|nr:DUF1501 domain-containing protein [Dyadobacter jejuensis]PWJ58916.1 uncharacterized protein (DUF1501 family) [Dyadobacter jejuensis]